MRKPVTRQRTEQNTAEAVREVGAARPINFNEIRLQIAKEVAAAAKERELRLHRERFIRPESVTASQILEAWAVTRATEEVATKYEEGGAK